MRWYKVVLSVLIVSILHAGTLNIGGPKNAEVLEKSSIGMTMRIGVDKLRYSTYELGGKEFTRFYLRDRGMGEINEVGKPNLPAIRRFIEVPYGAEVSYEIVSFHKKEISMKEEGILHPIMPSYPPVPKIKGARPKLVIDKALYKTDAYWPKNIVSIKKAGIVRGHNLYMVEFFPVRYNPVKGKLEVIKDITLKINYSGGNAGYTTNKIQNKYSPFFEQNLSKKVINYGVFESKANPNLPVVYLIITPTALLDSLQNFITWKREMGYHVHVATIPDSIPSGDTLTVKQYIQDAYNNWTSPPTFVLLVGDVAQIGNWWSDQADNPANDLGYALLDGNDYFPDVYVGRFSATTDSMVGVIARKVITYEKTLWGQDTLWAQKAFFIASADNGNHQTAEGTHLYCMNIVRNYGMIADSLFAYYTSGAPTIITNTINDGRALVTYSGHGSETGWADYSDLQYSVSDIYSNLTNGVKTPFEQTYACLTGSYANTDECYQEAWQRAPDKGAAAAFGSSVTSLWDEDDILQRRMFDEIFDSGYVWVMGAINAAKMDFYAHYGDNTGNVGTLRYFQQYNLFGDPSMYIYTHVPYEFSVSHALTIPFGTVNFNVSVSDVNGNVQGALVSAVQNGNLLDAKYTDATGVATLTLSVTTPDTVYITVTGYNHKPSVSYVIPSGQGAYVSLLEANIIDTQGNNNGRINPGEEIELKTLLKNWGQDTAYNVLAKLVTSSSDVNIIQDTSSFGDIYPGDSAWGDSDFIFDVSQNAQDQEVLNFQIVSVFQDTGAIDTTSSNLNLTVYAPIINAGALTVLDTFSQDNHDNVAQPGEEIDLSFSAVNSGHEDIHGVNATLTSNDPYITINTSNTTYGDISASSSMQPSNPFNLVIDNTCPDPHQADLYVTFQGDGYTFVDTVKLFIGNTGYFTDVEDTDTINWTMESPWHVSQRRYHSASHSFYFGNDSTGQYPNNANASLTSPYITVGPNAKLKFWTWYDFETNYDYGYVEYSTDSGATWQVLQSINGASDWQRMVLDLSDIAPGTSILIRFRGTSDGSVQHEGWYIDDIRVTPPEAPTSIYMKDMTIVDTTQGNGNGIMDPGETVTLNIYLSNMGQDASGVSGALETSSSYITIDNADYNFGDIHTDSTKVGSFSVSVSQDAPIGSSAQFSLVVSANSGTYVDTFGFTLTIGDPRLIYTGPDSYGYYAYDMYDAYSERPNYNWIEISQNGTVVADGDDSTEVVSLPFTFKYYGTDYNQVSICSNGWMALGIDSSHTYSNTYIPNSSSPNNVIAPFWDDLSPTATGSGKIYYYADTTNHMFIVEWDSVYHYSSSTPEKAEVILYDPAYNPTLTGDGEIVVMYASPLGQSDVTVGIENQDGSVGLQYMYDGTYDVHANEIRAQFAIKFTTDTPVYTGIDEHAVSLGPTRFELMGNFPNPFAHATTIKFAIPKETRAKLSIFDITGRKVKTLINGNLKRGYYTVVWNGRNENGKKVKSGVYFYVLQAGRFRKSKKMIMVK